MDIKNLAKQLTKDVGVGLLNKFTPPKQYGTKVVGNGYRILTPLRDNTQNLMDLYSLLGRDYIDESYLPNITNSPHMNINNLIGLRAMDGGMLTKDLINYHNRINSKPYNVANSLAEALSGLATVDVEGHPDYLKKQITSDDIYGSDLFLGAKVDDIGDDYVISGSYTGKTKRPLQYRIKYPKNKLYGYVSNEE